MPGRHQLQPAARSWGVVLAVLVASVAMVTAVIVSTVAPAGAQVSGAGDGPPDRSCAGGSRSAGRDAEARRRRVVTAAYCGVLRRGPDDAGMQYWVGQLDGGLTAVGLVEQLLSSDEYRARSIRSYRQSLSSLGSTRAPVEPDPLQLRRPMSVGEFDRWVAEHAPGPVEAAAPGIVHARLDGDGQRINVLYAHLSRSEMRVSPGDGRRRPVGAWAAGIGAVAAVNGNWFAPFDGPAVSAGQPYGGDDHFYTSLFGLTDDRDAIVEHHREVNEGVDPRIVDGVAGHPTLVHRGDRTTDFGGDPTFTARHPRTAIGLDASGDVLVLVTVDGRRADARGMTGAETASLLVRLGADEAVMLDGGGSTTMWIAGRGVVNRPSGGIRAVGNEVTIVPR